MLADYAGASGMKKKNIRLQICYLRQRHALLRDAYGYYLLDNFIESYAIDKSEIVIRIECTK